MYPEDGRNDAADMYNMYAPRKTQHFGPTKPGINSTISRSNSHALYVMQTPRSSACRFSKSSQMRPNITNEGAKGL